MRTAVILFEGVSFNSRKRLARVLPSPGRSAASPTSTAVYEQKFASRIEALTSEKREIRSRFEASKKHPPCRFAPPLMSGKGEIRPARLSR